MTILKSLLKICLIDLTLFVSVGYTALSTDAQNDLLFGTADLALTGTSKVITQTLGDGIQGISKISPFKPAVGQDFVPVTSGARSILPDISISSNTLGLESVVSRAKQALDAADQLDKQMFDKSIDTTNEQTDGFGPQLLTNRKAIEVSEMAELFLESAVDAVQNAQKSSISRIVPLAKSKIEASDSITTTRQVLSKISPVLIDKFRPKMCPFQGSLACDVNSPYRSADGSCNNKNNKWWGKSFTPFERFVYPLYDDDIGSPRTLDVNLDPLPGAREISIDFHKPSGNANRMIDLAHFFMEYGQFVSHDIQFNALSKGRYGQVNLQCCESPTRRNCLPIKLPANDPFFGQPHINRKCMNFVRSLASTTLECTGPRQQLNQNSHYLDGSAIYGSDSETMSSLRLKVDGLLRSSSGKLLPKDTSNAASCRLPTNNNNIKCFRAGDPRVNQQPALISLQTIWMREHNRLAKLFKAQNSGWDDEKLFQEARRVVIAKIQHITYKEYLPKILGNVMMTRFDLNPQFSGYFTKYNEKVKPMIRNSFMAAAYRFGHSVIDTKLSYNPVSSTNFNANFRDVFLRPDWIYRSDGGISAVTRGLYETNSQKVDRLMTTEVTRHLFERASGTGIDLAAINIQRGRDHGIPGYNLWREICGLTPAKVFSPSLPNGLTDHTEADASKLDSLYASVDDIDLFTGGVSEKPLPGAKVGPTFACLIGLQFKALKYGDRFYYESNTDVKFNLNTLDSIRKTTMSKIICDNTDIQDIPRDVFTKKGPGNQNVRCSSLPSTDCVPRHGGWTAWRSSGGGCIQKRTCTNPKPNECGDQCSGRKDKYTCSFPDLLGQNPSPVRRPPFILDRITPIPFNPRPIGIPGFPVVSLA